MIPFFWKDGHVDEHDADPRVACWKVAIEPAPFARTLPMEPEPLHAIELEVAVFRREIVRTRMPISLVPFDGVAFVEEGHPGVSPLPWKCYDHERGRPYLSRAEVEGAFLFELSIWNSPEFRAARAAGPAAVEEWRQLFLGIFDRIAMRRGEVRRRFAR